MIAMNCAKIAFVFACFDIANSVRGHSADCNPFTLPSSKYCNASMHTTTTLVFVFSFPQNYRQKPSIGNGYLGFVLNESSFHVIGIFNGAGSSSAPANIPNPLSLWLEPTTKEVQRTFALDMQSGEGFAITATGARTSI